MKALTPGATQLNGYNPCAQLTQRVNPEPDPIRKSLGQAPNEPDRCHRHRHRHLGAYQPANRCYDKSLVTHSEPTPRGQPPMTVLELRNCVCIASVILFIA